jgi:hypothetical protein
MARCHSRPGIVRLHPADPDGESIFLAEWAVSFNTPLAVLDSSIKLIGIELPESGEYLVRLESAGLLMASRSFEAILQERENR